jgi:hypothetical protein
MSDIQTIVTGSGAVYALSSVNGADVEGHVYQLAVGPRDCQTLSFQLGAVGEAGHNGVQNEQVITALVHRLGVLNKRFPCRENSIAITHLETALLWLEKRTADRRFRGVEGTNAP